MKMIHGLILALTLLVTSSLVAQDAPTSTPPTPTPAPEVSSAPEAAKPAAKKSKKAASPAAAPEKPDSISSINPPETGVVKDGNVNVRGRASFVGEVITKLRQGESVALLEEITLGKTKKNEPANWYRIAMPTNTPVWVNANFIDANSKTVKASKLQVRAGPGENFSVVGSLEKGASIKEIRTVEDWIEIETPPNTFAFVAADLIDRASTPLPPAAPEPAPEVVQVPAPETTAPADPIQPVAPPEPAVAEPVAPPVAAPEPVVEEPLPKRIVTREGIVRRSLNVQTPSYYELENLETGKIINYLYSSKPGFTLKDLIGLRVIVTGEEMIDKRWRNTPVIELEALQTVETP